MPTQCPAGCQAMTSIDCLWLVVVEWLVVVVVVVVIVVVVVVCGCGGGSHSEDCQTEGEEKK